MLGSMQDQPLLISSLLEFAERHHADGEIVSRRVEGDLHRYTYKDLAVRARKAARVLDSMGLEPGDRAATLAWNGYRHFELFYAVSGSGMVMHTVNPRLFPEQIAWIVNDAEDALLFIDLTFVPLIEKIGPQLKSVKRIVLMTDRAHMPATATIPNLACFEELVECWPRWWLRRQTDPVEICVEVESFDLPGVLGHRDGDATSQPSRRRPHAACLSADVTSM